MVSANTTDRSDAPRIGLSTWFRSVNLAAAIPSPRRRTAGRLADLEQRMLACDAARGVRPPSTRLPRPEMAATRSAAD